MTKLNVKIKKLREDAVIPHYAKPGDAGMDLTTVDIVYNTEKDYYEYHTGLAVEIPQGYVGLLFPRSSNRKTNAYMANHVGVIDSGYRGEIMICFKNRTSQKVIDAFETVDDSKLDTRIHFPYNYMDKPYQIGDRVAQLMILPYPEIEFEEVEELSETERGDGGFGHTGQK